MRDWEGKSIYIEIYRDIDIYTGTSRPRAAAGAATAVAGRHSQHLNTCISFADALKNWRDFFSRKNKTKHHDRPPYLVPNPQPTPPSPLSDKSEPDHGDCRSTPHLPWCCAPQRGWGQDRTCKEQGAQSGIIRKEGKPPPLKEVGRSTGVLSSGSGPWAMNPPSSLPHPFPLSSSSVSAPPPHCAPLPTPLALPGPGPAEDHR